MRAVLIADRERMEHEQTAVNRLVIGLLADGVGVTRIVPPDVGELELDPLEQRLSLATLLTESLNVLPWHRRTHATTLAERIGRSAIDAIYAIGENAWSLALDLGTVTDCPVALDIWCSALARRLPRGSRERQVGAYVTPNEAIANEVAQRTDPALVTRIPVGVPAPQSPPPIFPDDAQTMSFAVVGGVRDVAAYRTMLAAIGRLVREFPSIHVFLELSGPHDQEIWQTCRKLDLLENISTLANASRQRDLLTRCDAVILPERYGEVRTVLYEAMAWGRPVVASHDPAISVLVDDETAVIVDEPDTESWTRALRRLLTDRELARRIGDTGRSRMMTHHRVDAHASALHTTFERMTNGGAVRIGEDATTK